MAKTLVIVASALLSHLFNWCIVGACDAVLHYLNADIGSSAFTVGTALMLSEYAKFPPFPQKPSKLVLYVYYMLLSFFVSSLSTRLVWMPLTDSLAELNVQLAKAILFANKSLKLDKKSFVKKCAFFLETKTALAWVSDIVGVWFLYWVCDSLKISANVRCFLEKAPGLKKMFGSELGETRSGILRSRALRKKSLQQCGFVDVLKSEPNRRSDGEKIRKIRPFCGYPEPRE